MLVCQVSFGSRPVFVKLLAVGGASPSWVTLSLFCSQAPTKTVEVEAPTKTVEVDGRTVSCVVGWSQALRGHNAACTKTFFTGQPGKCFRRFEDVPENAHLSTHFANIEVRLAAQDGKILDLASVANSPGFTALGFGLGFAAVGFGAASVIRAVSAT